MLFVPAKLRQINRIVERGFWFEGWKVAGLKVTGLCFYPLRFAFFSDLRLVLLQLDFLQFEPALRISKSGDTTWVFDPIRRKQIVLTPEEMLRQLVLLYLLETKKYPANRIRVEIGLLLNERPKRCDIVVFDPHLNPWLVVECKSPKVALSQATFEQAARYNLQFRAPFLAVTNGLATFSCALDFEQSSFSFLEDFPEWEHA